MTLFKMLYGLTDFSEMLSSESLWGQPIDGCEVFALAVSLGLSVHPSSA